MAPDHPEPIDLEPIDLEPGDPERRRDWTSGEPRTGARPARVWVALAAAGLVAWGAIALTTRGSHAHPTATPTSTAGPAPVPPPPVAPITILRPLLSSALRGVGSGHFAIVVDDRLYLLDTAPAAARTTLVPLPEGHVTIADQSGRSVLATTFQQTIVTTGPEQTRTLAVDEVAIRGAPPNDWVLLGSDGTIRDLRGDTLADEPAGLRVFGVVDGGYVADDPPHQRWVLWSAAGTRTIAPGSFQLIDAGSRALAFKSGCGYGGCALEITDLRGRTTASNRLDSVPQFAAFSPDGTRLALASTEGGVSIVDTTGPVLREITSTDAQNVSLPFSWTPDGRTLVVVGSDDLQLLRASDGRLTTDVKGTEGLEQLVALP